MGDTLQYLKKYYDLGFALIWLYPNSKRPIGDEWQRGERKHFDTLKKTHKDAYNVGVRLGTASRLKDGSYLCVLDADVKSSDPVHLQELEAALEEISDATLHAPRVLSGRGGGSCHIYFRTPKPQQSFKALRSKHKVKVFMPSVAASEADRKSGLSEKELEDGYRMRLAWEVDVFGEGKQVVLPPSIHPDTYAPYTWEAEIKKIEQIPLVENFDLGGKVQPKTEGSTEIDYDFSIVEAYDLSTYAYKLITEGTGLNDFPSRSEALMSCINSLVKAGLKDKEINAVLTDKSNFMAEKALEKGGRDAGAKWLRGQVAKARSSLSAARDFDDSSASDIDVILSDEEAEAQAEDLTPWVTRLKGKEGAYKNTAYNIDLILSHGFNGVTLFHYNEFTQSVLYKSTPPWGDVSDIGRELSDVDLTRIRIWLSRFYGIECGIGQIDEVVTVIAVRNGFHPIKEYINGLTWDKKPRLDTWLFDYLEAEGDAAYVSAVGRKVLCAAVARVFNPGCKFDYMMILEGRQGSGKSSTVEILASKKYFSDNLGDVSNKDILEVTRGKWFIEVSELSAMNRAGANEMKDFLSKTHDTHRKAFARKAITVPRQFVLIGTTNDEEYLKDPTGGRRFWPIKVGNTKFKELERDRDQLIAEAFVRYGMGEPLYLEEAAVKSIAEQEQYDRQVVDEIEQKIIHILKEEGLTQEISFDPFYTAFCLKYGGRELDYALQNRCKKTFIRLGFKKIRKRVDGLAVYRWVNTNNRIDGRKDLSPKTVLKEKGLVNEILKDFEDDFSDLGL